MCGAVIVAVFVGTIMCQRKAATVKKEAHKEYKGEIVQLEANMAAAQIQHSSQVDEIQRQLQDALRSLQQEKEERATMRQRLESSSMSGGGGGLGGLGTIGEDAAMTAAELTEALGLAAVRSHPWHLEPCCALTGEGCNEGMEWVASTLASR